MPIEQRLCPVRAVTQGPRAHFFGYYDKPPWDPSGRYMLALEADPVDRLPLAGEKAVIGLIELSSLRFERLAETAAWNWQQGCMLQWLPTAPGRQIIYNDCQDARHVAVILDIHSGARRVLPRPIYSLTHDGRHAVSTNMARLAHTRPVVGYAGARDPWENELHPTDDGIYWMDLTTGQSRLVVPLDAVARFQPVPGMDGAKHRFEHLVIAPDGKRFFFLQRWPRIGKGRPFHDRLFTANADGSELFLLAGDDLVSHFDWRDPQHILAWARREGEGDHFFLFKDRTREAQAIGADVLTRDGHCTYSPDRRWILADAYPDAQKRCAVWLYEVAANRRIDIGFFAMNPGLSGPVRCDLHPRFSRDARQVCIDSAHEGPRQMYVLDVAEIFRA
jgi:hypothetical protein